MRPFFAFRTKTPLHTGMRTGCHYLSCLCVLSVCNILRFYYLREPCEADSHKLGIYGSERAWANAWDVFPRMSSRVGCGRRAPADFEVRFRWDGFSSDFLRFYFLRTHTDCCKYEAIFPHLTLLVPGCVQSAIIQLVYRSVCPSVCLCIYQCV